MWCLKSLYENVTDIAPLVSLFSGILEVPDVGLNDLLDELSEFKVPSPNFDDIYNIYQILHDMIPQMTETEKKHVRSVPFPSIPFMFFAYLSREYIEDFELVYHPEVNGANPKCWYPPSECLWSTTTEIKGMRNISNLYEELFAFFVDLLGVPTLTLEMVVDKLAELGKDQGASVDEIKNTI